MNYIKKYDNGLRLVINKIDGLTSACVGVLVQTGSANENEKENGISHFIEHTVFKGTKKRSSFEISDYIDRIGAQINAFTSKELTCYYTKSTKEHVGDSIDVLSDIFFDATFIKEEIEKEKGVIIEEINMSEDTPEDLCLDILSESYYGKKGLGRTILGPEKNIKGFTKEDVYNYMDKYYTADNVVISVAGNIDVNEVEKLVDDYFNKRFTRFNSCSQVDTCFDGVKHLYKYKDIEQAHIGLITKGYSITNKKLDALNIANTVLGGGMSSRLFQKIREDLGLCYSVYSYPSQYRNSGVIEIYAGVNKLERDSAVKAIIDEVNKFKKQGITKDEFMRGKEQLKSGVVFGRESSTSQMLVGGKYLLFFNDEYNYLDRIKKLDNITLDDVMEVIDELFDTNVMSSATVGKLRKPLSL